MTDRNLVYTISRVPTNLPALFDALVRELLRSPKLGAGKESHYEERQPRHGLSTTLDPVGTLSQIGVIFVIELVPLANSVDIYAEIAVECKSWVFRLMKGLIKRMMVELIFSEITSIIGRILTLESQNYVSALWGIENGVKTPNSQSPLRVSPPSLQYCPACGLSNPKEAHYCETCGSKLLN